MKKLLFVVAIASILSACGTTNTYDKRADAERERSERGVERAIDKAPKWMSRLPESNNAVYANGTAISRDYSMADEKARMVALSHLCMSAGGEVDKQSKLFISDTEDTSTERSEMAIRSMCRRVDVSGAEMVDTYRISENGRFRSYVLMALPIGDANGIAKRNDARRVSKETRARSDKAFNELDSNNKN